MVSGRRQCHCDAELLVLPRSPQTSLPPPLGSGGSIAFNLHRPLEFSRKTACGGCGGCGGCGEKESVCACDGEGEVESEGECEGEGESGCEDEGESERERRHNQHHGAVTARLGQRLSAPRPGVPAEPEPQRSDRTVRHSSWASLSLALPVLAAALTDNVDSSTIWSPETKAMEKE